MSPDVPPITTLKEMLCWSNKAVIVGKMAVDGVAAGAAVPGVAAPEAESKPGPKEGAESKPGPKEAADIEGTSAMAMGRANEPGVGERHALDAIGGCGPASRTLSCRGGDSEGIRGEAASRQGGCRRMSFSRWRRSCSWSSLTMRSTTISAALCVIAWGPAGAVRPGRLLRCSVVSPDRLRALGRRPTASDASGRTPKAINRPLAHEAERLALRARLAAGKWSPPRGPFGEYRSRPQGPTSAPPAKRALIDAGVNTVWRSRLALLKLATRQTHNTPNSS